MQHLIHLLNKAFENRIRLGVMSVLMVNDIVDFNDLKSLLAVTDGNLSSHTKALEKEGYIVIEKSFVNNKPKTTYQITINGKIAFQQHIDALEKLLSQ